MTRVKLTDAQLEQALRDVGSCTEPPKGWERDVTRRVRAGFADAAPDRLLADIRRDREQRARRGRLVSILVRLGAAAFAIAAGVAALFWLGFWLRGWL